MSAYVNSLVFMGAGVVAGVGVVAPLRPPRPVLVAAGAAGLVTALTDFVCAALGHHYDLWHLHGALTVLGVPLSLSVAWVTLTAALVVLFHRFTGLLPRVVILALAALGGASVDHYVLRPSQMLTWGRIPPAAIAPYWLSMVGLAVGVFYLALRLQPRRDRTA